MITGRMPACTAVTSLARGLNNTSVPITMSDQNTISETILQLPSSRFYLPFVPPKKHKKRYKPIEIAKVNLKESHLQPLKYDIGRIYYHPDKRNKDDSYRKVRSEQRAIRSINVGQIIAHHNNLETGILGYSVEGKFINLGVDFITKKSGLSYHSVHNALNAYERSGYISIKENKTLQLDGSWKSTEAIITVSPQFYFDLGVSQEEFNKYRYKQNSAIKQHELANKTKEYLANRKLAKREMKAITNELKKKVNEMPGSERIRASSPLYKDYTGIAKNRDAVIEKNNNSPQSANVWIASILEKLKSPPS